MINVESKPIRIDAHQHFRDLSRSELDYGWNTVPVIAAINKNYLPENFVDHLASTSIHDGVLGQTQHTLAALQKVISRLSTEEQD